MQISSASATLPAPSGVETASAVSKKHSLRHFSSGIARQLRPASR
jgi:hypothetical protein